MLFLVGVTSTQHYWVISAERRRISLPYGVVASYGRLPPEKPFANRISRHLATSGDLFPRSPFRASVRIADYPRTGVVEYWPNPPLSKAAQDRLRASLCAAVCESDSSTRSSSGTGSPL